jgi:hypothetical protein
MDGQLGREHALLRACGESAERLGVFVESASQHLSTVLSDSQSNILDESHILAQ